MKVGTSKLESSRRLIRMALKKFPRVGVIWNGSPTATFLLHLMYTLGEGKGEIPVIFIDTGLDPPEVYSFADWLKKEWNLRFIRTTDRGLRRRYLATKSRLKKRELLELLQERALRKAVRKYRLKALIVATRWDEDESTHSEVYFSPQKRYTLIQPLLHFTIQEVELYLSRNNLPFPFSKTR